MLQLQYYNNKLTKTQIEKILTNYNIKYNTMKNEIDAKFNSMIKLFVNDIRGFLENIEEISNERKKIKEAENSQIEIAILKSKLEEKVVNENKMKNEIDSLTKENSSLKIKIKEKTNVKKNRILSDLSNPNSTILKSEIKPKINKYKKLVKEATKQNKDKNKEKNNNSINKINNDENKINNKKIVKNRKNNRSFSTEKRNSKDVEKMKSSTIQHKNNQSMEKRTIKNIKNISIRSNKSIKNKNRKNLERKTPQKMHKIYSTTENNNNSINNKKNISIEIDEKYDTLEIQPFDQSIGEDESFLTVDDVIDEEIKELEMDEENIILLMDQIKQFNNSYKNYKL